MDPVTENYQRPCLHRTRKVIVVSSFGSDHCVSTENVQSAFHKTNLKCNVKVSDKDISTLIDQNAKTGRLAGGKSKFSEGGDFENSAFSESDGFGKDYVMVDWEPEKYLPSTDHLEARTKRRHIEEVIHVSSLDVDQLRTYQEQELHKSKLSIHLDSKGQSEERDGQLTLHKDKNSDVSSFKISVSGDKTSLVSDSTEIGTLETVTQSAGDGVSDSVKYGNASDSSLFSLEHLRSLDSVGVAADSEASYIESSSNSLIEQQRDVLRDFDDTRIVRPGDGLTKNTEDTLRHLSAGEKSETVDEDDPTLRLKKVWSEEELQAFRDRRSEDVPGKISDDLDKSVGMVSQLDDGQKASSPQSTILESFEGDSFRPDENKSSDWKSLSRNEIKEHSLQLDDQFSGDHDIISSKAFEDEFNTLREENTADPPGFVPSKFMERADLGLEQGSKSEGIPTAPVDTPSMVSGNVSEHRDIGKNYGVEDGSHAGIESTHDVTTQGFQDGGIHVHDLASDKIDDTTSSASLDQKKFSSEELVLESKNQKTLEDADDNNEGLDKQEIEFETSRRAISSEGKEVLKDLKRPGEKDFQTTLSEDGKNTRTSAESEEERPLDVEGHDLRGVDVSTGQRVYMPEQEYPEKSLGNFEEEDSFLFVDLSASGNESVPMRLGQDDSVVLGDQTTLDHSVISGKHIEMVPFFPGDKVAKEDVLSKSIDEAFADKQGIDASGYDYQSAEFQSSLQDSEKGSFDETSESKVYKPLDDEDQLNESLRNKEQLALRDIKREDDKNLSADAGNDLKSEKQKAADRKDLVQSVEDASLSIDDEDGSYRHGIISGKTFDVSSVMQRKPDATDDVSSRFKEEAFFDFGGEKPASPEEQFVVKPVLPKPDGQRDSSRIDLEGYDEALPSIPGDQLKSGHQDDLTQSFEKELSTDRMDIPGKSVDDTSLVDNDDLLAYRGVISGKAVEFSELQHVSGEHEQKPIEKSAPGSFSEGYLKEMPSFKESEPDTELDQKKTQFVDRASVITDHSSVKRDSNVDMPKAVDALEETHKDRGLVMKADGGGDGLAAKLRYDSTHEDGQHASERGDASAVSGEDVLGIAKDHPLSYEHISGKNITVPSEISKTTDVTDIALQRGILTGGYEKEVDTKKSDLSGGYVGDDALERGDISTEISRDTSFVLDDDSDISHKGISSKTVDLPKKSDLAGALVRDTAFETTLHKHLDDADTRHESSGLDFSTKDNQQATELGGIQTPGISEDRGILSDKRSETPSLLPKIQDSSTKFYNRPEDIGFADDAASADASSKLLQKGSLGLLGQPQENMSSDRDKKETSIDASSHEIAGDHNVSVGSVEPSKEFKNTEEGRFLLSTHLEEGKPKTRATSSVVAEHKKTTERGVIPSLSEDSASSELGYQTPEDRGVVSEQLVKGPSSISEKRPEGKSGGVTSEFMRGATLGFDDERKEGGHDDASQFMEEKSVGRDVLEDVDGAKQSAFKKNKKDKKKKKGREIPKEASSLPSADSKEFQESRKSTDSEGITPQSDKATSKTDRRDVSSRDLLSDAPSSEDLRSVDSHHRVMKHAEEGAVAGLDTEQSQTMSVVVPTEEFEELKRIQQLDEEKKLKELEEKRLREIEEQKRAQELEEQRRLQELEEQKRLEEIAEQKRLQELEEKERQQKLKEQERLEELREQRRASCQPFIDKLQLFEQKLVDIDKISSMPEKLEEKKQQLEELLHELNSLETALETLKETQKDEWSEIYSSEKEGDPLAIASSNVENLKQLTKKSSENVQKLIEDHSRKEEQLSKIEKQIEGVQSWFNRAVAATFERPVRTSSSRFVKEQLLDATNVCEELDDKVQELKEIGDQIHGLPTEYADMKSERHIEGKLDVLHKDVSTLKANLEDKIRTLKREAETNEKRQKEVEVLDANLADIQKKVLLMLKSPDVPSKEEIDVWQNLQKPSRDLQKILKLHLQEQQELIKTVADQHEILKSSLPETSQKAHEKVLTYTPLPLPVVTGEPGSSKILEATVEKKVAELRKYWKDLKLNKNATLDDYVNGQNRFDAVMSMAFQWLDSIESQASKMNESEDLQNQTDHFRVIHQDLLEQLKDSAQIGQSLIGNLPTSSTEQIYMLTQSLEDLDRRLSLLEDAAKLREQLTAEKKTWQKNLDGQLANIQGLVRDCQQKFISLSDGKIPSESRLTSCQQLSGVCKDSLRKLDALKTEVQLRHIQDPSISVPPDLFSLRHQLSDLDGKVAEKKTDLSRTTDSNSQYETLLEQYAEFLETAHEKVKTAKPSVKDLGQLKDQLSSHRDFFQDLVSHQTLTESLCQKVEPHVKERFNSNRTRLNTLTRAVLDKANSKELQMKQAIDHWLEFEPQFNETTKWLDNVEKRLPQRADEKDSIEMLERKMLDLQSIQKDLENGRGSVSQMLENGRRILKLVSCPGLQRQLDDVADRHKKLNSEIAVELKSLEALVKQSKQFDSEVDLLENWMKTAAKKKESMNQILSNPNPSRDNVTQAENLLRELKDEYDEHQNHKTLAVSLGNKIVNSRPSDARVRNKLKEIGDAWSSLGNSITDVDARIQNAQKTLLPSRQALGEILQYLDTIYLSVAEDDNVIPKSREDVHQLLKKYKSLRGDLANLQLNVDYVNKVAEQSSGTGSHSDQTFSAEQLGEMNRQYQALCSDVNSKAVNLELISDTWKDFEYGAKILKEFLNAESAKISAAERNLNGNIVATTLTACTEFSNALKEKEEKDLKSLDELGSSLTQSKDWPSDSNAIANIVDDLSGQCDQLAKQVNSLKLSAERMKSCLEDYNRTLDGVNNVLDTTGSSLNKLQQTSGCNAAALKEQIASLKTLQRNFDDSSQVIEQLETATAALTSACDPASSLVFQNNKKQTIDRWQSMKDQISEKLSSLEALSSKWNGYDQRYADALNWLHAKESEIDRLLKDGSQDGKEESLKQKQRELSGFGDKIMELDTLSKEIIPSLDGARVVHLVSEQTMLSEMAKNLQLLVDRHLENLDLAGSDREKLTEQCAAMETFLKEAELTMSEASAPYDASDYDVINNRLNTVKHLTEKFVEMNPRFQELSRSGYRLPLSQAESSRLKDISDRWNERNSESKALEKKLQQQSLLLQSFSDKCEGWNKFLADVEKSFSVDLVGNYSSIAKQQQQLEKFQEEVFPRQQILYSIIDDGHRMIESSQGDTVDFGRKLQLLEEQWQTVVRQANQRKAMVDNIMTLWLAYHKLRDQLSSDVKGVKGFVDGHPVSAGSFDSLRRLLDEYTENQSKLESMEPTAEKLQSYAFLLSPNSDQGTVRQIDLDVKSLDEEMKNLNAVVASNANQLQNALQLWDSTRLKMENFLTWLKEIKKYVIPDVPTEYDALVEELRILEELQSDKSSRCDELTKDLGQLTQFISAEDSLVLCQRLRLLTQHQSEVSNQISERCETVKDRLNRWRDFDRDVENLMTEFSLLEAKLNKLDMLSIEDSIAAVQNDLQPELEILETEKIKLIRDGKDLRKNSRDLRATDVDNKMTKIHNRYAQLKEELNTKLNKLTVTLGTLQQLENNIKELRRWLRNMEHLLTSPVVYETSDAKEIQAQLEKQKKLQEDIDKHSPSINSVLSLCDSLSSDHIACPTPDESQSLQLAKAKLESRWKKINDALAQRKQIIEETGRLWKQFNAAHQSFSSWLRSMERQIARPETQNMTFNVMQDELKEIQRLQGVIQRNLSELDSLNRLYCRLAHEGRTDSKKTLKKKIDDANHRWDNLLSKADVIVKYLNHIISVKDDFDTNRQALMIWLSSYNDALTELELLGGSPSARIINFVKKELGSYSNRIDYVDRAAKYLVTKCEPSAAIQVQKNVDEFHRLHSEVLRRLKLLDGRLPSDVEDEPRLDRVRQLESELAKCGKTDALELEAALGRLDEEDEGLDSLLRGRLGDEDTEASSQFSSSEEAELLVELAELEKWLVEANAILYSERKLPQDMTQYDQSRKKHQDLTRQIEGRKPTVFWIRSALSPAERHSLVTTGLDNRISKAVDKWDKVCRDSSDWFNRLQLALIKSKEFHLNVEELSMWINDVQEEITVLDHERPVDQEKLYAIENDLEDIGLELEFLKNIGDYFLRDSDSSSARADCNQLNKLANDLEDLRAAYRYQRSRSDKAIGSLPGSHLSGSRDYSSKGSPLLFGAEKQRTPRHARLRKHRGRTPEGGAKTASGDERRSYFGLLKRACRTAIPIQVMMLVLIGVASLVPMCENECVMNSLNPMLKFTDGAPPL